MLTPPRAPHTLAHAIQTLRNDTEQRLRIGEAAAAYAKQYFGLARQVNALFAYDEEIQTDWQQHNTVQYAIIISLTLHYAADE